MKTYVLTSLVPSSRGGSKVGLPRDGSDSHNNGPMDSYRKISLDYPILPLRIWTTKKLQSCLSLQLALGYSTYEDGRGSSNERLHLTFRYLTS